MNCNKNDHIDKISVEVQKLQKNMMPIVHKHGLHDMHYSVQLKDSSIKHFRTKIFLQTTVKSTASEFGFIRIWLPRILKEAELQPHQAAAATRLADLPHQEEELQDVVK